MKVRLVRHTMPGRPDWTILEDTVPLGTVFEVYGYDRNLILVNAELDEAVSMDGFYLVGNNSEGWLPTVCFETVHEEHHEQQNSSKSPTQIPKG